MAIQGSSRSIRNTGFGFNSAAQGGRLVNKDGTTNLRKTGLPVWERISIYHTLLRLSRWKFLGVVVLFYTSMNLLFAGLYLFNGVSNLHGVDMGDSAFGGFLQAFFFSSQTLTTVGYGHISPAGFGANIIASLESFIGILSFALVTGLLYARFTRPRAYLRFSERFLIAPFDGGRALMLRIASYKNNYLTDVEATVMLALRQEGGATRFYPLDLEISRISSLALSWTVNHPITEKSPLYGLDEAGMRALQPELIVAVKAFDDHFSNTVQQRTSYNADEMVYGARFVPMFRRSEDQRQTVLELDRISDCAPATLPQPGVAADEPSVLDAES